MNFLQNRCGSRSIMIVPLLMIFFFACSYEPVGDWKQEDLEAIGHYYSSIRADNEYLRVLKRGGSAKKGYSEDEMRQMRRQIDIAVDEARLFLGYPDTLRKMNQDLRYHFSEEYLDGLLLTKQTFAYPDADVARRSDNLYNSYVKWFYNHREEIHFPTGK